MKNIKDLLSVRKRISNSLMLVIMLFTCLVIPAELIAAGAAKPTEKKIKIALLLDTSNSMDGLIEQAKSQLWQLVNELAKAECDGEKPSLFIALYEYGNDNLVASEGYIHQVTPLTNDLDQISEDLFKLTTNGGSEFCGQVIQTAVRQQEWSSSDQDLQIIFIAGNEPFTQGGVDYRSACSSAQRSNIIVNTIHCGSFDEGIRGMWKDGAVRGGGQYMCIEQDRKTVFIASPYDDRISVLNEQLNSTYIGYGHLGETKKMAQQQQDNNAMSISRENSVKRAVSKSNHFYKNASWDLVDASKEEDFKLDSLDVSQLPAEMKNMSEEERVSYIREKSEERTIIQKEINVLNEKRLAYVKEKQEEAGEEVMLDRVMITAIKEQAAAKSFEFK